MGTVTWNSGRSWLRNFGRLTSMIERSTRISSDCSGYLSFKFPAAVSTDFTARIPEQHHHHHTQGRKETHDSKVTKYIFDALLFLQWITFFYHWALVCTNNCFIDLYLRFITPQKCPKPKTVISFLCSLNLVWNTIKLYGYIVEQKPDIILIFYKTRTLQ